MKTSSEINANPKIKVAIADDHRIFRKGVILSLKSYKNIEFVAEASDGDELLGKIPLCKPQVILCDLKMPKKDGVDTTKLIKQLYPDIRVLIITMYEDERFVVHLMGCGASGYLLKSADPSEIYFAIMSSLATGVYLNPYVNRILINHYVEKNKLISTWGSVGIVVSEKEREILQLLSNELADTDISEIMRISVRTVKAIKDRLMERFKVKNTVGLIFFAMKNDLILIDEGADSKKMKEPIIDSNEMIKLFSLSISVLKFINHDLRGQKSLLKSLIEKIGMKWDRETSAEIEKSGDEEMNEILKDAFDATEELESIANLIKSYLNWPSSNRTLAFDKLFVSRPNEFIEIIKKRYPRINIDIHKDSSKTIEIIYPPNILISIFSELVKNAQKNKPSSLKILIKWEVKEALFCCEVHDNGPGFLIPENQKFVPYETISANMQPKGMGLSLIARVIFDSDGHLFFSHSKSLNGAMIYFDFPIIKVQYKTVSK